MKKKIIKKRIILILVLSFLGIFTTNSCSQEDNLPEKSDNLKPSIDGVNNPYIAFNYGDGNVITYYAKKIQSRTSEIIYYLEIPNVGSKHNDKFISYEVGLSGPFRYSRVSLLEDSGYGGKSDTSYNNPSQDLSKLLRAVQKRFLKKDKYIYWDKCVTSFKFMASNKQLAPR